MAYPARENAVEIMIRDARAFYEHGWMLGTSGNLSVRTSEEALLVTASGRDKGRLKPEDFIECPLEGRPGLEHPGLEPSAEAIIHQAVYRHLDEVGAVYHVHEPYAAFCSERDSDLSATLMAGAEMLKGLGIDGPDRRVRIPVFDNHDDVSQIAADVATYLSSRDAPDVPGVNIRSHGVYAWGKTPFEAKRHIETFAYLFRYSWELGNGA